MEELTLNEVATQIDVEYYNLRIYTSRSMQSLSLTRITRSCSRSRRHLFSRVEMNYRTSRGRLVFILIMEPGKKCLLRWRRCIKNI